MMEQQRANLRGQWVRFSYSGAEYQVMGYGPKRVIIRYGMTSRRYYVRRRLFDCLMRDNRLYVIPEP